jgi:hypothetical protein
MAGIERFIASAMSRVRIVPDAPTIMPATISAVLFSAMPVAAALRPVNALSSEITTGMSAPADRQDDEDAQERRGDEQRDHQPLGRLAGAHGHRGGHRDGQQQPVRELLGAPDRDRPPGQDLLQLAEAMFEPQNDTEPTIAANRLAMAT